MNRMRSFLLLISLGVLSVALVACDGAEANGDHEDGTPAASVPSGPLGGTSDGGTGSTAEPTGTAEEPSGDDATSDDGTTGNGGSGNGSTGSGSDGIPGGEDFDRVEALAPIEEIDVRFAESFPVQHFLYVVSGLPSGCAEFQGIDVERDGTTFKVTVTNTIPDPNGPPVACTMIYGLHESNVALGSDLVAGTEYTVDVNGEIITFTAQ